MCECSKIRDNVYEFPKEIPLSAEAEDLITWILRPIPSERPTLSEILAHPFLVTGPFPSRISPRCAEAEGAKSCIEEWRYMTKRQARENFARVKRAAGVIEDEVGDGREEAAGGVKPPVMQALEAVAEAVEEEVSGEDEREREREKEERERKKRMVRVRGGTQEEREAKGRVEKEVKAATAPESPISELLRYVPFPLLFLSSSLSIDCLLMSPMRFHFQIRPKTSHGFTVCVRSKSSSNKFDRTNPSTATRCSVSLVSRHHFIMFYFCPSSTTFIPPFTNGNCQFRLEFASRFEINHSSDRATQGERSDSGLFTRSRNA